MMDRKLVRMGISRRMNVHVRGEGAANLGRGGGVRRITGRQEELLPTIQVGHVTGARTNSRPRLTDVQKRNLVRTKIVAGILSLF